MDISRWVAGIHPKDAVKRAGFLNKKGIKALINFLGEHCKKRKEIENNIIKYIEILKAIRKERINADISLKPTQIGLASGRGVFYQNLQRIISCTEKNNIFVWVDMEGGKYVSDTIDGYLEVFKNHKNAAVTIQCNRKRSRNDVSRILKNGGKIRLCKGAYDGELDTEETRRNFLRLMKTLSEKCEYFAAATHDRKIIERAVRFRKTDMEFQMLMGLGDGLKEGLIVEGYNVSEYVPFGANSRHYVQRRLKMLLK